MEHWLEREIAQWVHRTMSERSYHGATSRSHIDIATNTDTEAQAVTYDE